MTTEPEEITIQTPTFRLAARVWGPADGIPTLALHGWLDNAASFDGIAPSVSGLRIVCLDLPGHGLSEHGGAGESYAFVDTVARVHAATVALGWSEFCLVGHSLGAAVASVLAGTFPDRVRAMALIEGLGPIAEPPAKAPERLALALTKEEGKRGRRAPVYASVGDAVKRLEASMSRMSRSAAEVLCARGLRPTEGGFTWRSDPRLRLPSRLRLSEEQVLAFIGAITCPTLLVCGSEGFPFAPLPGSARVAALAHSTRVELPGGHHVHLDTPQAVADALVEFFGSIAEPG